MKMWMNVDPTVAFTAGSETVQGREMSTFPSPYNIPRAIRAEKSSDGKKLRIFFRYLDGQEAAGTEMSCVQNGLAVIRYGRTSGRIAEIEVDVIKAAARSARAKKIVADIDLALENCGKGEQSSSKRSNFRAAQEAVHLSSSSLVAYV